MSKATWLRKIKDATEAAGTYRPYFDATISVLADIMDKRDDALKQYDNNGGLPTIERYDSNQNLKVVRNPALTVIMDLNNQALAYWRDLGLTPAGLRKIDEKLMAEKKPSGFADLLAGLNK